MAQPLAWPGNGFDLQRINRLTASEPRGPPEWVCSSELCASRIRYFNTGRSQHSIGARMLRPHFMWGPGCVGAPGPAASYEASSASCSASLRTLCRLPGSVMPRNALISCSASRRGLSDMASSSIAMSSRAIACAIDTARDRPPDGPRCSKAQRHNEKLRTADKSSHTHFG